MIGNDVVDLNLARVQSNWQRNGFLDKVFLTSEKQIIQSSIYQNLLVWLLWSMKEAAYKAHQRRFLLPRKLNWQQQQCRLRYHSNKSAQGEVRIGRSNYFTKSTIASTHIYTLATLDRNSSYVSRCFEGHPEKARRELLIDISKLTGSSETSISLFKNTDGIPLLMRQNDVVPIHFSLSSHGKFSSFCWSLTKP